MKLESSFSVRAPIDEVWAALLDVERVAPCVPGAHVLERRDEDVYGLELELALGAAPVAPARARWRSSSSEPRTAGPSSI